MVNRNCYRMVETELLASARGTEQTKHTQVLLLKETPAGFLQGHCP